MMVQSGASGSFGRAPRCAQVTLFRATVWSRDRAPPGRKPRVSALRVAIVPAGERGTGLVSHGRMAVVQAAWHVSDPKGLLDYDRNGLTIS